MRHPAGPVLTAIAAVLVACGGTSSTTTSASLAPSGGASPSAAPTPPETERVDVVETGLGAYLETIVPVAVIASRALRHTAHGVTVHLVLTAGGRLLGMSDVTLAALAPGASASVAGRVAGAATTAVTVSATVSVGGWDGQTAPILPGATGAIFSCPRCGTGPASGDVNASIALVTVPGPVLQLTAVCRDAGGAIVGGGSQTFVSPSSPGATAVTVPAVVSRHPAACTVDATLGGF